MKIKDGFILRQVGGQTVVVAVGDTSRNFNGIIRLNSVGTFLWEALSSDTDIDTLVGKIVEAYDIDEATARADAEAFIEKLRGADILD